MAKKNEAGLTVCGYDQARFISKLAEFRTWKARAATKGEARVFVFTKNQMVELAGAGPY